jgi:diguanylate cyclase (GGDEF)-like protein
VGNKNIRNRGVVASPRREDKAPSTSRISSIPNHRSQTLRRLLEKHGLRSLLPANGQEGTWAMIYLMDGLSENDRAVLQNTPHISIQLDDNLVDRIIHLENENKELRALTHIDNLTGLFNSRFFSIQLEIEMARTRRTGLPCSLLVIDLDNFKHLNDTLGHLEGNKFLRTVSVVLRDGVRPTDMVCRYGGDEFAVIMPATTIPDATRTAERLKSEITGIPGAGRFAMSASIGVSEYTPLSPYTADDFMRAADAAMYQSKQDGKDRISVDCQARRVDPAECPVTVEEKAALWQVLKSVRRQGE